MDFLPIIEQALSDIGVESSDDPEFVGMLRNAAPALAQWAEHLRNQIVPEKPQNGVDTQPHVPEPPQPGTLAYDREAGIPVFTTRWPD